MIPSDCLQPADQQHTLSPLFAAFHSQLPAEATADSDLAVAGLGTLNHCHMIVCVSRCEVAVKRSELVRSSVCNLLSYQTGDELSMPPVTSQTDDIQSCILVASNK